MRKKLLLGNWKMNKTPREAKEFALGSKEMVEYAIAHDSDVGGAPTYVCLQTVTENADPRLILSAQNKKKHDYPKNDRAIRNPLLHELEVSKINLALVLRR